MSEGPRFSAGPLWRARIEAPREALAPLMLAFEDWALSASAFDREDDPEGPTIVFESLHEGEPDLERWLERARAEAGALLGDASPEIEPVPETDWLRAVEESFPPRAIGPFWLRGGHVRARAPEGAIEIVVDAGLAFGSGEHPTTRGCLESLARLRRLRPKRVLDMGCGSGVLAIAAAKLWPSARVLAVDNDPVAVDVAAENAARNGARVQCEAGEGFDAPGLAGRFDLVLANILAGPLIEMAGAMASRTASGGRCVLSGLLDRQAAAVRAAYLTAGFGDVRAIQLENWSTLTGRKRR